MTGLTIIPSKLSTETVNIMFNFVSSLAQGETIESQMVSSVVYSGTDSNPSAMVAGSASQANGQVIQGITGGNPGTIYDIVCRVTTSLGQALVNQGFLAVTGIPVPPTPPASTGSYVLLPNGQVVLTPAGGGVEVPPTRRRFSLPYSHVGSATLRSRSQRLTSPA